MTPHWAWGLVTAVILTLVIWLNGQQIRAGWLLGATVQLINVTFGWLVYGQWTFAFLLLPAGMFLWNYWRTPRRKDPMPETTCPACNGTGTQPGTLNTDCGKCGGTGTIITK